MHLEAGVMAHLSIFAGHQPCAPPAGYRHRVDLSPSEGLTKGNGMARLLLFWCPDFEFWAIKFCFSATLRVARQKRLIAARISPADLLHLKGLGVPLWVTI